MVLLLALGGVLLNVAALEPKPGHARLVGVRVLAVLLLTDLVVLGLRIGVDQGLVVLLGLTHLDLCFTASVFWFEASFLDKLVLHKRLLHSQSESRWTQTVLEHVLLLFDLHLLSSLCCHLNKLSIFILILNRLWHLDMFFFFISLRHQLRTLFGELLYEKI